MLLKIQILLLQVYLVVIISARNFGEAEMIEIKNTYLPTSEKQRHHLAMVVCYDLEFYLQTEEAQQICQENFGWDLSDQVSSSFQTRCRAKTSITYKVPPSRHFQLLLLVPEPNDGNQFSVMYKIIRPNSKYDKIDITEPQDTNYTAFSTVLDKRGTPQIWHHEAKVGSWLTPPRDYVVQVNFVNTTNTTTDGLVTWNRQSEFDSCFELVVGCDSRETKSYNIGPDSPPRVKVEGLPLDEECFAKVIGMYGETRHGFMCETETGKPTRHPKIIETEASEVDDTWTVKVVWSKPDVMPDFYNVTLRADNVKSFVVRGNVTEKLFTNVTGEGTYNVSVYTIVGDNVTHTSTRALFPPRSGDVWRWAGVAVGAWMAAAAGVVAAALYYLRFRRRIHQPHTKIPNMEEIKPFDEPILDPIGKWSADAWEVKSERLQLHEVIGEGAFGVVRRGTLAPTGKEVAVKMLKDFPSLDETRDFHLEMELMKSVGAHAHVVSLVGCCSGRRPLIIAEYCNQGDLLSFLRCSWDVMISKRNAKYYNNNIDTSDYRNDIFKIKPQEHSRLVVNKLYDLQGVCDTELTSRDLLSFCRQIAMGMEFLASNRLVHRDLAARNILVTSDRTLKIADFGLSRDVYEENQYKQKGNGKMPVKWMALESLTRRIYTTQSDVWSFGVVVWEVVTVGGSPYPEVPAARLPRLLRAGYRMPRPANCAKLLYEVMLSCWRASPRERPTFAELHTMLDELLNSACADEYLSLELDDEPPPTPRAQRYFKMILRAKRNWTRGESYERPLKAPNNNYYTPPPVTMSKNPV